MNSPAAVRASQPTTSPVASPVDRWLYVFMAGLFILTALTGFIPDSVAILAEIKEAVRPPLSPALHMHALCMGCWMLLLFAQAWLIAVRRPAVHRKIGLVALVLVPLIIVSMVLLVRISFQSLATSPLVPAIDQGNLQASRVVVSNLLPEQIRAAMLFGVFAVWGFWMRSRDACAHKRLMMLATLMPLPAALDRIDWLPSTLPASSDSTYLYMLLWLSPLLLYDLWRRGRPHWTYVAGIVLNLPFVITSHVLAGSPWWLATAPRLMNVQW